MEYRVLGKSGLKISAIGFGGIPIQRGSVEEAKGAIVKAQDLGINFIDTARGYTVSEEFIGEALEKRRSSWIIATKSMARDKVSMAKDIEISLKNLRTNYIDLYQLHNIKTREDLEKVLSEEGAYRALIDAKESGKIGHIGLTSHSLELLEYAIELDKFETIMYPYNIVENQADELFKRANELNIGVIAMKPLAGGAIEDGTLALKFIRNNPAVTVAIPGMGNCKEVEENSKVYEENQNLSEEDLKNINEIKKELGNEFCRRCGYCAPCPRGIDIPTMFIFSGYKERYGLGAWAEDRYFSQKNRAKDCIECGACEKKCPYELPIRKMLAKVRRTFNE
ncbi:aldo/keto reductase [Clostridium cadaveris]